MEKRVITIVISDPARDQLKDEHLKGPVLRRYLSLRDVIDDASRLKADLALSDAATVKLEDAAPVAIGDWAQARIVEVSAPPPTIEVPAAPAHESESTEDAAADSATDSKGGE